MSYQFVRMAQAYNPETGEGNPNDPTQRGASLWNVTDETLTGGTQEWWLTPEDVQRYDLVDVMRQALNKELETAAGQPRPVQASGPREGHSEAIVGPDGHQDTTGDSEDEEGPPVASRMEVLEGEAAGWRWKRVSAGITVWAVDNRPAIDAWAAEPANPDPPPAFQAFVLPDDLIQALTEVGPYSSIEYELTRPRDANGEPIREGTRVQNLTSWERHGDYDG